MAHRLSGEGGVGVDELRNTSVGDNPHFEQYDSSEDEDKVETVGLVL
jgi:hypothetical protein